MILRFLTYNIHKGIGTDRKFDLDRIIYILEESKADIICLQEVDNDVPRSRHIDTAKYIADHMNFHYVFSENVRLKSGCYGNATLSRFPIIQTQNLDITWRIKKKRGVLITDIAPYKNKKISIFNCHLGLAAFERSWQMHKILTSSIHRNYKNTPVVILGDTNDGRHKLNPLLEIAGYMDSCETKRIRKNFTFPAYAPVFRIDKVFYNEKWISQHHKVLHTGLTRIASDHSPLLVELELKK